MQPVWQITYLKATLKDVQYDPKPNFNLFSIRKAMKENWKLSGDKEGLVLMKNSVKLVFDIKITTKNGFFSVHTCREINKLVPYLLRPVQQ